MIDTGDRNIPEYISNLQKVLKEEKASIHNIIVTHWHHDHVGGVPDVLKLNGPCEVSKLKRVNQIDDSLPDNTPFKFLNDGEIIETEGATLK